MVRQAERLAAGVVSGPADALRLSLDFLGPVSTDPVVVVGEVVRTGRSITLRRRDPEPGRPGGAARPGVAAAAGTRGDHPDGVRGCPEPAWTRTRCAPYEGLGLPVRPAPRLATGRRHAGRPGPRAGLGPSPGAGSSPASARRSLQRAALVGDSGSGVSAELDWDQWSFLNIDLDLHLLRSRCRTSGCCSTPAPAWRPRHRAVRHDHPRRDGACGTSAQTLVVRRVPEWAWPPRLPSGRPARRRLGWWHGAAAPRARPGRRDRGRPGRQRGDGPPLDGARPPSAAPTWWPSPRWC